MEKQYAVIPLTGQEFSKMLRLERISGCLLGWIAGLLFGLLLHLLGMAIRSWW